MKKQPRDYQLAACDALWNQVHTNPTQNPLCVMPTGTGKSLTMALFIWGMLTRYPHLRIMNLTHVKELVKGNYKALLEVWPSAPAGVYSAGLGRKDIHGQVTFAGIDSIRRAVPRFGRIDFVLIDEAHRVSDDEKSGYLKVITELRKINPAMAVVGFTATDYRMGMGRLTAGKLFDTVCFDLSDGPAFVWMCDQNYLIRPVPKATASSVDDTGVKIKAGEFEEASAAAAVEVILEQAIDEIIERGDDRQAWLIFAQSIDHCELIEDMFRYKGFTVEAVHSKRADRDAVLDRFAKGQTRGVVNKDILTTGYDNPRIDLIASLRLTRSPGLWVQMVGRGTRPCWEPGYDLTTWEGRRDSILASHKQDCLVLDFAKNTVRLGPINYPTIPKSRKGGGGEPPVRECPVCGEYIHISIKVCPCGYEFPAPQTLTAVAASMQLVHDVKNPPPKEYGVYGVSQMFAQKHPGKVVNGEQKPPSIRVDYFAGAKRFTAWVFPEHQGFALKRSQAWWSWHARAAGLKDLTMPATVDACIAAFNTLAVPKFLKVWLNTKYPEIEDYDFRGTRFELPPELGGPALQEPEKEPERPPLSDEQLKNLREMFDDEIPF